MNEEQPSIELDRLALIIGHQQIKLNLQQDEINALLRKIAQMKQTHSDTVDALAKRLEAAEAGAVAKKGKDA